MTCIKITVGGYGNTDWSEIRNKTLRFQTYLLYNTLILCCPIDLSV